MAKPTSYPNWATNLVQDTVTNALNKLEPTTEFKLSGLLRGEKLARAFFNFQFNLIDLWIQYLDKRNTSYTLTGTELDPANGEKQSISLAANTTLTEVLADGESLILHVTSNAFTITWPASFDWGNAGAPTLTTQDLIEVNKIGSVSYPRVIWSKT